ncbi:mannosyl-oligosaccharide 1,2-alpha-mannosidase IC [Danio aesculapii]|uniref:mannosyl-oligosaccharide 1,2-alpha-mannosidase IC n=1 Tax=Danio aesculapii TaxID=1142201 RepID=UPI0024BF358B|nr:mannosyl-oligosaccharide 1,2-alpha-mannosidase IC [Danio aesculapii]
MVLRKLPGVSASGMGLRLSQKFVFLLFLSGLVTLCFGALFFLPDSVRLKRIFLSKNESPAVTVGSDNELSKKMPGDPEHQRAGLKGAEANLKLKVSRKPSVTHGARTVERSVGSRAQDEWSPARAHEPAARDERVTAAAHNREHSSSFNYEAFKKCLLKPALGKDQGTPSDSETLQRREKVKEMMKFAWDNYKLYAWGKNELRPLTRNGHIGNMFGGLRGASIVDSLDTLYIMGLMEEYEEAKEWVQNSLDLNSNGEASLFEVNIRYVGGLLSAFYLTGAEKDRTQRTPRQERKPSLTVCRHVSHTQDQEKEPAPAAFSFSPFKRSFGGTQKDSLSSVKVLKAKRRLCDAQQASLYNIDSTKLGPEAFRFDGGAEATATRLSDRYYILRPEVVESYMYMWRLTHDPKYREWGWEAVEALEKHCRVDAGFSGIRDVYATTDSHDNMQQSFFLSETLKYLYLLFSEDDLLPLEDWVFNTEAHPLPIIRKTCSTDGQTPLE